MRETNECIVGVDVGGTSVRIGRITSGLNTESFIKVPLSQVMTKDGKPDSLVAFISDYCLSQPVAAVAIGLPGTLDRDCEKVLNTPNIPGLKNVALKKMLESSVKAPVFLENDSVMLLSGDLFRLGLKLEGVYLGCYIGTGLGSAIFIDGKVPKGKNGINELGHIPIFGKKERCSCGNTGCAENYVSGRYLQSLRANKFSDTDISDIFTTLKNTTECDEYIEILALILATTVNLLDPNAIILGGGVTAMKDFPKQKLFERIRDHSMKPVPSDSLRILYSPGSEDAGVFGAALYAKQMLHAMKRRQACK
jgi:allose kinase